VAFGYHNEKKKVRDRNRARREEMMGKKKPGKKKSARGDENAGPTYMRGTQVLPTFASHGKGSFSREELAALARERWNDLDEWVVVSSKSRSKYQVTNLKDLDAKRKRRKKHTKRTIMARKHKEKVDKILKRVEEGFQVSRNRFRSEIPKEPLLAKENLVEHGYTVEDVIEHDYKTESDIEVLIKRVERDIETLKAKFADGE